MSIMRQRAKPSFVVEIKRTARRTQCTTKISKAAFGNELLERVFGSGTARVGTVHGDHRRGEERGGASDPLRSTKAHAGAQSRAEEVRRALRESLSPALDPVADRIRQEAE